MSFFSGLLEQFTSTFLVEDRYMLFLTGLTNTLLIAVCATALGILIGILGGVVKVTYLTTGRLWFMNKIVTLYTTFMRGTPLMVQLLIFFFLIFSSATNPIPVAILGFGLNSGAYVSEIIRGGILSIDRGQMEAGRSLGLSYSTTMRSIVIPQALRHSLPSLGNELITLLKDTSIIGFIAGVDLTKAANLVRSRTYSAFFPLIAVALVYLLIVIGLERLFAYIERRMARSDRD